MQNIIITESQYNRLFEGIEYTSTGSKLHPRMNLYINHSQANADNLGPNNADTRMFNNTYNMLQSSNDGKSLIEQDIQWKCINYLLTRTNIVANSQGRVPLNLPDDSYWKNVEGMNDSILTEVKKFKTLIEKKVEETIKSNDWDGLKQWIGNYLSRYQIKNEVRANLYNRAKNVDRDSRLGKQGKVAQYRTGTIPGTNVKFIALFGMDDFNFSDALKHGMLRPNTNTEKILGYDSTNKIELTYDDGIPSNVENNFSRDKDVEYNDDHYKKQYGYGDKNYTSPTMFIDKSIMFAAYALKEEKYQPQYIIAAPSSSKFNHYYATALANKLGVSEYVPDFFQRNLMSFTNEQGQDIAEQMRKDGIEESLIVDFLKKTNNLALREVAAYISEPIRHMMDDNYLMFASMSAEHYSRERVDMRVLTRLAINYVYKLMVRNKESIQASSSVAQYLLEIFGKDNKYIYGNDVYLMDEFRKRIQYKVGRKTFKNILTEVWNRINEMSNILSTTGYKLKFNQPFKVTTLSKKTRPYLKGIYVVADKNFNQNRELFQRFTKANFLLIDEDLNSGTTLRNSIEALQDVMPEQNTSQIMCLVNAYSSGGF